ncbi:MAG: Ig-like domain-containing protein [Lachnospiraceae bacterium]|nr:Ig-like domain-containing protein [Lachnospiraceae bacterium]
MKHTFIVKSVALTLVAAMIIPNTSTASTSAEPVNAFCQSIITHTPNSTDSSFVHYEFTDARGNPYEIQTDTATETTVSPYVAPKNTFATAFQSPALSATKKATDLPSSYDLREENIITSIKDQGYSGACWAFGAMKSAESNAIRKGFLTKNTADFSESHLTWFAFHPSLKYSDKMKIDGFYPLSDSVDAAYLCGGSSLLATFTLAKWSGIVSENTAPFQSKSYAEQLAMAKKMEKNGEKLRYKSGYHLQNATCYDSASPDVWKNALLETSALTLGIYYNPKYLHTRDTGATYYQTSYRGSSAIKAANHCVTVVGWDDNYSHLNFPEGNRPTGDGAWLIANSYGTGTGDDGYFWLSYEEPSICDIYSFDIEKASNYSNNYQYDGFGWGGAVVGTTNQKGANIFQTRNDYNQNLKAVGLYTITDNQPYTIQIYKNPKTGHPTSGTLVISSTTSGTIAYNGFHTIPLKNPVALSAGQRFSVVVTYKAKGMQEIYLPLEGESQSTSSIMSLYSSASGQSYYYSNIGKTWLDTSLAGQNNICIKAYATNTKKVPVIRFTKASAVLGVGEKISLPYTLKHITKNRITWKSNKKKIAAVSSSGNVTAKKRGTAIITATGGTAKASIKIKVKKTPSYITVSPKKKILKRGKKYRIKTKLSSGSASYTLKYTSNKPKVASVSDKGIVTAHRKGKATIRIRTYNKKTAKIVIHVKK